MPRPLDAAQNPFQTQGSSPAGPAQVHIANHGPPPASPTDSPSPGRAHTMDHAHLIGWGHTPFGKLDALDLETLIRDAALPAIASAGLEAKDIDGIFVGHFNGGFVPQDFTGSLVGVALPPLRHVPAVRVENACATGSAAIWAALDAVGCGRVRHALVVGLEKMNTLPGPQIGEVLLKCS